MTAPAAARLLGWMALAACVDRTYREGRECSEADTCPPGQRCFADRVCRDEACRPDERACGGDVPISCRDGKLAEDPPCAIACADGACVAVAELAAGNGHTCVRLDDGSVRCWGQNDYGELGNGSFSAASFELVPAEVAGLSDITDIAAGNDHNCALDAAGVVSCWGRNDLGELGNGLSGTGSLSATPVPLEGLTAVRIAAGGRTTCAITTQGEVACWGFRIDGQLWNGMNRDTTPTTFGGFDGHTLDAVEVGISQACAIIDGGDSLWCWGSGAGICAPRDIPAPMPGFVGPVDAVGAGDFNTCMIGDGEVECWYAEACISAPSLWSGLPAVPIHVDLGWRHTCALLDDGSVQCEGRNNEGQLGRPVNDDPLNPLSAVEGLSPARALSIGWVHNCAQTGDETVVCWGGGFGNGRDGDTGDLTTISWR